MVQVDFLALQDNISEVKKDDIYEIICKNIKEEHFIKSIMHDGNMRVITISDFSKIYTEKYDTIFIKNAEKLKFAPDEHSGGKE